MHLAGPGLELLLVVAKHLPARRTAARAVRTRRRHTCPPGPPKPGIASPPLRAGGCVVGRAVRVGFGGGYARWRARVPLHARVCAWVRVRVRVRESERARERERV